MLLYALPTYSRQNWEQKFEKDSNFEEMQKSKDEGLVLLKSKSIPNSIKESN